MHKQFSQSYLPPPLSDGVTAGHVKAIFQVKFSPAALSPLPLPTPPCHVTTPNTPMIHKPQGCLILHLMTHHRFKSSY